MQAKRLLLVLALLLTCGSSQAWAACSSNSVGTFTCIQSTAKNVASSATPSVATGSNVASTSVVLGEVGWVSVSITLNSLTLTGTGCSGASSAIYDNPLTETAWRSAAFALWGLSSGTCTIQFNLSGAADSAVGLHEIAGAVNNADPVGARHNKHSDPAVGTGTDAVTTGAVTALGTDYIFAATIECSQGSTINAGTGYTGREGVNDGLGSGCYIRTEDKSASGSNTGTFTDTNATQYNLSHILSVAASGGAAACTPTLGLLGVGRCGDE